jgi:hypothetical protein
MSPDFPAKFTTPVTLLLAITLAISSSAVHSSAEEPYEIQWIQQFGTNRDDAALDITADATGNIYIAGHSRGTLFGSNPQNNTSDAILAKYDENGKLLWSRQSGIDGVDAAFGVSLDGMGSVYISGQAGASRADGRQFLAKYTDDGDFLWNTQDLGPIHTASASNDVAADALGSVYVVGTTEPESFFSAYVAKYDDSGMHVWTREFGIGDGDGDGVFADGLGNVYATGSVGTGLGQYGTFLHKYDAAGELLWTQDLILAGPSGSHQGRDVLGDGVGNVYVAGGIDVSPLADGSDLDAFLAKYDTAGNHLWTRQLRTDALETAYNLAADAEDNVYMVGATRGSLGGANAGGSDVFVAKYNSAGDVLWTLQFGTSASEGASGYLGISADGLGNVYIAGETEGNLGGTNAGLTDAFLVKLTPPAAQSLPGDYNNNGLVEQADLDLVLSHWGDEILEPAASGWLNDPPVGFVDQQELDRVLTRWGKTSAPLTPSAAVPEPATAVLLVVALALIGLLGKRTSRAQSPDPAVL